MQRVFSVEEIPDPFWPAPPPTAATTVSRPEELSTMNRSPSEWAFQCFLQEVSANSPKSSMGVKNDDSSGSVVEIKELPHRSKSAAARGGEGGSNPINENGKAPAFNGADDYQTILKNKLDLACAAVALQRGSLVKPQDSVVTVDNGANTSNTPDSLVLAPSKGSARKRSESPVLVKPTTSGSSRELSDDDEAEGENDTGNPTDVKRVRRMLSNRESARRSRKRKQAHMTELETQVNQLRGENSSLVKRYNDVSQKYTESAVDNRILKADVETLRAKVKMAEETVKRVTGLNPLYHTMPNMSTQVSTLNTGHDMSADAAVPVRDEAKHHFYQPAATNTPITPIHNSGVNGNLPNISAAGTTQQNPAGGSNKTLRRVASLEHLQQRIRGGVDSHEQ